MTPGGNRQAPLASCTRVLIQTHFSKTCLSVTTWQHSGLHFYIGEISSPLCEQESKISFPSWFWCWSPLKQIPLTAFRGSAGWHNCVVIDRRRLQWWSLSLESKLQEQRGSKRGNHPKQTSYSLCSFLSSLRYAFLFFLKADFSRFRWILKLIHTKSDVVI